MLRRILDSPWTYFVGAAVLLLAAVASQFRLDIPSRPVGEPADIAKLEERDDLNLVFILIDTLRADRLGIHGYERATSPVMDDLARYGAYFENVWAQSSWTKTSMASLWTGTYPATHGVLKYKHRVPEAARMPAEIFREAGFRTAGVWRNGWVAPNFGFAQGFEVYHRPKPGAEQARIQRRSPSSHQLRGTDQDAIESGIEFLRSFGDERFFLYLHLMDVHQYLYDQAAAKWGNSYSDAYDQSINWTDRLIGHLVRAIDDMDLLTETVIVITSDHGEAFLEHGREGHARDLYAEVTKTPWIIAFPFRLDPGVVVRQPVANVDVWPTILDLFDLSPMPGTDGRSLVPLLVQGGGGSEDGERPLFTQIDRRWGSPTHDPEPAITVSEGGFRLFRRLDNPDWVELYDWRADPLEQENLAAAHPEEVGRLTQRIEAHVEGAQPPWGERPEEVELDQLQLDQLRALGYVIQ